MVYVFMKLLELPGGYLIVLALLIALINSVYRKSFVSKFSSKCVFITGCDTGFGNMLARRLDELGLTVFAGCLTESGAEKLKEISSSNLKTVIVDITSKESVGNARKFVEAALPPGQGLWGLVNNAGTLGNLCFDFCTVDDFRKMLEVNFFGVLNVNDAFLPLIKKTRGRVVTVTSIANRGMFGACPYTCAKSALALYSDSLRRFLRRYGVHVAAIEPGYHRVTNLVQRGEWATTMKKQWEKLPEKNREEFGESHVQKMIDSQSRQLKLIPFHQLNNAENVVNKMVHALGGFRPKDRYVCGWDANFVRVSYWFLPDWLIDSLYRLLNI